MKKISDQEASRYPLANGITAHLETPAVLVDRDRMQANIDRMQSLADWAGLNLRPHVKTHKSLAIATRQLTAGARGLTASKVDDALVFIEAGLPSVTLAYPQTAASKLDRLLAAARRHGCNLRLIVDSIQGLALLTARAAALDSRPGVFIKIDAGSKTLSSDRGAHGIVGLAGYGLAFALGAAIGRGRSLPIAKLSEEHGFVVLNGHRPKPGDRLQVFPNHACPVVNLTRQLYALNGDTIETWAVDASGCVR